MKIPLKIGNNHFPGGSSIVLAGDIGATKTNLALVKFEQEDFTVLKENKFHTYNYTDAGRMIAEFLGGDNAPDLISLGVAGPVQNGKVKITNLSWEIDGSELSKQSRNKPVYLVNDLEATAYGLAMLTKKDIHILYQPEGETEGNIALIAPGTGLGEAGLYWDGEYHHPFATEGGHSDFAPRNDFDIELYYFLNKQFGHVSWERVVSGRGIVLIYDFLRGKNREVPDWLAEKMLADDPAAVISENAINTAICKETMDLFLHYLAIEAANLSLKLKATGGLYIGGGILPKILKLVNTDSFLRSFRDFGRMKHLLQHIPVTIILNDRTALIGAAYYGKLKKR